MKIENLKPSEITPYFRNPRKNDDAIEGVAESIKAFGFKNPILLDQENVIVAGHTRWKAALKLDLKTVPCIKINGLSPAKINAYRIADNKYGEKAEWDFPLLKDELEELDTGEFDLELTGFGLDEIEEMMTKFGDEYEGNTDDDAIPEDVESICKTGQLWKLGEHRLLCGDATKKEDVERLLNNTKTYNMLTDPPYNINFKYNKFEDKKDADEYADFCKAWFNAYNSKALIFSPGPRNEHLYPIPKDKGVWIKKYATAGASVFYLRLAEPLLFYGNFNGKRNTDVFDYSTGFPKELKDAQGGAGVLDKHAPVKSVNLWLELLKMFDNNLIVDCFLGNGTTIIACEKTKRKCYGMEIDEHYCDVIIKRWEDYTGNKAELI